MRRTLDDPGFPALATQLGLMKYWKATRTKPDACNEKKRAGFLSHDLIRGLREATAKSGRSIESTIRPCPIRPAEE